jgi:hypothetical protein
VIVSIIPYSYRVSDFLSTGCADDRHVLRTSGDDLRHPRRAALLLLR